MNYWQITASRVQNNAPGQPASRPVGPKPVGLKSDAPVQSQALAGLVGIDASGAQNGASEQAEPKHAPRLSFEALYTQSPSQWPGVNPDAAGQSGQGSTRVSDKVIRMMQASPNLTMAQVKAILKVDRFE